MDQFELDANDVINNLLEQIAQLSREKAMLQVQLAAVVKNQQKGDDVDDVTTEAGHVHDGASN